MPKQALTMRGRYVGRRHPLAWILPAIHAIASLTFFFGGIACLWLHAAAGAPYGLLVPAGIVLVATSLVQAWIIVSVRWTVRVELARRDWLRFGRAIFLGIFVSYLATVAIGSGPYCFATMAAVFGTFYCLILLPLVASPRALETWRQWVHRPVPRRTAWVVQTVVALAVCGEVAMQVYRMARSSDAIGLGSPTVEAERPSIVDRSPEKLDLRFAHLNSGRVRVAIVGDATNMAIYQSQEQLSQLQRIAPGLEIVPVALARPWSMGENTESAQRVLGTQPDLVLAVVASCENLTHEPAKRSWFNWRQLEWTRLVSGRQWGSEEVVVPIVSQAANVSLEDFLGRLAPELIACRTPIAFGIRERWQRTFIALDQLVLRCREKNIAVSLVVAPSRFQVDPLLFETLVRRQGLSTEQFDIELPQRYLADYAQKRNLDMLDLLPPLRSVGSKLYERNTSVWNDRGSQILAAAIGGWLESCYGSQLAAAQSLNR